MTEIAPALLLAQAYNFAARQHVHQRRKGEAAEPYINHLTEVAELVAAATEGSDPALIMAAVLHDSVEDTDATPDDLTRLFGADVVVKLTFHTQRHQHVDHLLLVGA